MLRYHGKLSLAFVRNGFAFFAKIVGITVPALGKDEWELFWEGAPAPPQTPPFTWDGGRRPPPPPPPDRSRVARGVLVDGGWRGLANPPNGVS